MHEERKEELQDNAERGRLVKQVVTHRGWTEIIRPQLDNKRNEYLERLREAKEHTDFLIIQQSINAIDWLLGFIENTCMLGEGSFEELQNTRKASAQ